MNEDKERAFLSDLEWLTRKHGVMIFGCGCCGSPSLVELDEEQLVPEAGYSGDAQRLGGRDFAWICPGDFAWDHHGARPVKETKQ